MPTFEIIASHINEDFICAGSFPAALLASIWSNKSANNEPAKLIFNDIDVYHGEFGEVVLQRHKCEQAHLKGIEKEVNLISCTSINVEWLMANCDINAVAVFVLVNVLDKKIQSVKQVVGAPFWDFLFCDRVLRSWQTDSPTRTLVRLAFKSQQLGVPFSKSGLSLLDGEVFASHKKKHEEMLAKWEQYPFKNFRLKSKSKKKSYKFITAYLECLCGRKANLNCNYEKCSKCCSKELGKCKAHKNKPSKVVVFVAASQG